jgi:hypothetical protein
METILGKVQKTTYDIIELGKQLCTNQFSQNIFYQKIDADELNGCINFNEQEKLKLHILTTRPLLSVSEIVKEIEIHQNIMGWIDFQLYYVHKQIIVIMVIFVPKKRSDAFLQFHSCFDIPPWVDKGFDIKYLKRNPLKLINWNVKHKRYMKNGKFDINWQKQSLVTMLKIFWWRTHARQKFCLHRVKSETSGSQ